MRTKLMEAILKILMERGTEKEVIWFNLKLIPDANLVLLAQRLGVDTDALMSVKL